MNVQLDIQEQNTHTPIPTSNPKVEQQTAAKAGETKLDENQNAKIRNFIFSLFKKERLRGHVKVQNFDSLEVIEIILFHKISQYKAQEKLRLTFTPLYPLEPPTMLLHSCNLTIQHPEYSLPNFLSFHEALTPEKWTEETVLGDVIADVYENINNFHKSEVARLLSPMKSQMQEEQLQQEQQDIKQESISIERLKKQRRKNSSMTGCADKELTQTKNLNRHFRSKLREVLRDLEANGEHPQDAKFIDDIFTPNRVGFEDIRKALSNKWFNEGVRRQMNCGQFLHKILRGMMGIKSKKLMIKYYHVMVSAAQQPTSFIRWKYD